MSDVVNIYNDITMAISEKSDRISRYARYPLDPPLCSYVEEAEEFEYGNKKY